jgi:hypothetical protein
MGGIPKDDLFVEYEDPYIIGEMDRDPHGVLSMDEYEKYSGLGVLAAAACNHGAFRVILTGRKAYAVTSDWERQVAYDAR